MFNEQQGGSIYEVPDNCFGFTFKCWRPPLGYGVNSITGELQPTDIIRRSNIPEDNFWERFTLPKDWNTKRRAEKERQRVAGNSKYVDPYLEAIRMREWKRRLCGVWFDNYNPIKKEVETLYITGTHYLYATYWKFQGKFMDFRINDMDFWYVMKYCEEDPDCLGLNEITKRKLGKTAKLGCWLYDRTSKPPFNQHAGIQSKADDDAEEVMKKALVQPWQKLPDFFRPIYDTMKGDDPNELRFFHTSRRGSTTENEREEEDALESWIDFGASGEAVYDGPELDTYAADEAGKCFGKGTKIRMYDGSVKNVEEIRSGEFVMGDDSTKRTVYGVTKGIENMYNVVPNKGYEWSCNESHILSLKWCTKDNNTRGWKSKSVVNISVKDYLGLKKWEQNHLMLYRSGVEYNEKTHYVSPYFFGLWLGDGTKKSIEITTDDSEIVDYLYKLAEKENLNVSRNEDIRYYLGGSSKRTVVGDIDGVPCNFPTLAAAKKHFGYSADAKFTQTLAYKYNNLCISEFKENKILSEFGRLNVLNNKHIPNEYLIDSRKNRLELLAGLIDSDGYLSVKNGKPKSFEITQKLRTLAYQIQELATSLGYYCSVYPKIAKMKRLDKSIYECMVYRVQIYGDLYEIPTIVKRKQAEKCIFHVNRRNPQSVGFKINNIGVGEYFGFAVNKNSLFLLSDGTVVHNTKKPVNIRERQSTVRFCSEIDGRFNRSDYPYFQRKQLYTTTVEIEKGEEDNYEFQVMTAKSNPLDRNENNRTTTGLYTYFLPAQKGMRFDGKYGYPDEEGATFWLLNEMKKLGDDGDTRGLSSFKRKNPMNFKMAFSADGLTALYDPEMINEQLDEIAWRAKDITERGNLIWKDGFEFERPIVKDDGDIEYVLNEIEWQPNPNGKYEKLKGWWPKEPNKVFKKNGQFLPNNNFAHRGACDPFKYDKTKDKRRSNCAGYLYQIHDDLNPDDPYNDSFPIKYAYRESSTRLANMDILKMMWLCGCQCLFERNVNHWKRDFQDWNCAGFLMWLPGETEPGIYTDGKGNVVQMICNYTEAYINQHIKKVMFPSLLRKETGWLGFKVDDTQIFDEPMAAGFCLIAVKGKRYVKPQDSKRSLEDIMPYRKAV